jgi:hypothetical protein
MRRIVSREKTTTTLLDKRRIRVDRNKNKLSANYCAVRFAEITPVSRSAGAERPPAAGRPRQAAPHHRPDGVQLYRLLHRRFVSDGLNTRGLD